MSTAEEYANRLSCETNPTDAVIEEDAQVGAIPENLEDPSTWGVAVVGSNAKITKGKKVEPKDMIPSGEEV